MGHLDWINRERLRNRERNGRPRQRRPLTLRVIDINAGMLEQERKRYPEPVEWRPRTRADCFTVPRPCPYVGCRHNLYLDITKKGGIKLNFPDLEPHQMRESCSLDVAARGPQQLEVVGELMNVVRERIRQVQVVAERKLRERIRRLI